jgi:glucose-6-phosphate dehydrogenase assembly protein OpcA
MTVAEQLRTVGAWSGQDVDAGAIQAQLTKLWRSAVEHSQKKGEPAAARTNVLTLVAYADTEDAEERVLGTLASLAEHHPSRTLLVRAEPGAAVPSLAADVVTRCRVDRPQVCFEQIVLHAHGSIVEQVSSAVASLLLRDLPTYLWWPEDIREQSELLRRLVALGDGVIVDSSTFTEPAASLPTLLGLFQEQVGAEVADLQWARLTGWRESTAQFFDSATTRQYLDGITQVEVDVRAGDRPGAPGAGILYVAWLASRLGWRSESAPLAVDSSGRFALIAGDRRIAITVRPIPHDETAGDQIGAVRLEAAAAGKTAAFAVHCASRDQVTTRSTETGAPVVERTMRLPAPTDAAVLAQLLGYFRPDPIYEQSVRTWCDWLGLRQ